MRKYRDGYKSATQILFSATKIGKPIAKYQWKKSWTSNLVYHKLLYGCSES